MSAERRDQRLVRGEETRQRILERAVQLASMHGVAGLSLGELATDLGMSKAGVFAHFGSKEELQIATLDAARELFVAKHALHVMQSEPGMARVWALSQSLLQSLCEETFRGGCFFSAASAELDDRPGVVRDRLVAIMREWLSVLGSVLNEARSIGHLREELEPEQLAFELQALYAGANWARRLFADEHALDRARQAIHDRLHAAATTKGKRALGELTRS